MSVCNGVDFNKKMWFNFNQRNTSFKNWKKIFKTPNHTKQFASLANNTYFVKRMFIFYFTCIFFNNSRRSVYTNMKYYVYSYQLTFYYIYSKCIIGHVQTERQINEKPRPAVRYSTLGMGPFQNCPLSQILTHTSSLFYYNQYNPYVP